MARTRTKNTIDTRQIAVYVRKSKITETGKSIEIQKEKCIALACAQFDVAIDDIFIYEDEGKSGFYADRPQYRKMLRDIEGNKLKAVICYKIDRISRRTVDLLNLVQQMEQKGISFISVSDRELDTSTRTGKIMISLLSAIAEFERDIIAERITDNMYELAKEGRWLGGECPLGYASKKEKLIIGGKKTTINHLEPIEEEQQAVQRLIEIFLRTSSLTGTAVALNNEGFKTKKGKGFTLIAVKNILQNPVYAIADADMRSYFTSFDVPVWADEKDFDGIRGIMAYNKTEQTKEMDTASRALDPKYTQRTTRRDIKDWIISVGKHKGIVSGADWIRVQGLLNEISQVNSARPKEVSKALLSGLVRCTECGSRMFVRAETGRYNPDGSLRFGYRCDLKYRKKGGCESSPNVKGYELDNFVIEQICKMSNEDNTFYSELLDTRKTLWLKSQETEREQHALKKRIHGIGLEIQSQTTNLRSAPDSVKQAIYADIEALTKERDERQERLDKIHEDMHTQDSQIADIEKAKQTILDFPRLIQLVDYEGKLQLLRRIIECVIVKGDIVHIFLKGTDNHHFFGKGHERTDARHIEPHSIIYTPCRIRRKACPFVGVEGGDGLD
jgi:site-specific DNA recombinase